MTDSADRTQTFTHPAASVRCPDCKQVRGPKHAEVCPGPWQIVAPWPVRDEPECDCPPSAWHEPGCELVSGDAA